MTVSVTGLKAVEVLDSRGKPTLAVTLTTTDGTAYRAGVPSGASTGSREAVELRDGDPERFGGNGVLTAVGNVTGEIAAALCGRAFADQPQLDQTLSSWTEPMTSPDWGPTPSWACRWPVLALSPALPDSRSGNP